MSINLTGLENENLAAATRGVVQKHLPTLYNLFPCKKGEKLPTGLSWRCSGNKFVIRYTPARGITRDRLLVKLLRGDDLTEKELELLTMFDEAESLKQLLLQNAPTNLSKRQNVNPWGEPEPEPAPEPEPEPAPEQKPAPEGFQFYWQGWFTENWGGKTEYKEGIEVAFRSQQSAPQQSAPQQSREPAARGWNR